VISLLLVANVFNLGADIGAMGSAAKLLLPGPAGIYIVLFGGLSLLLEDLVSYIKYVRYLKWLTLALFTYVATAIVGRLLHSADCGSGNYHQPLPVFLASVAGGRGGQSPHSRGTTHASSSTSSSTISADQI